MKLDRNEANNQFVGCGKYAIVNLRKLPTRFPAASGLLDALEALGMLEYGAVGSPDEFFVLKLKDKHSRAALLAYAASVLADDPEFAQEVERLAARSGPAHPLCKSPD